MKRGTVIVGLTAILIIVLSYQPPMDGNAQVSVETKPLATIYTDTTKFNMDLSLIDSLKTYESIANSLKLESKESLHTLESQQKIVTAQTEIINIFTKN